ncbi:hypothetical protein C1645_793293 [Glomus cerebriforme]|uniref:Uncharacterized protein n=1 Tax=Glomus cerebriforme TaxID=658196 RepID=A0A397S278_9GLOM|nr:hypothetical protein C1645_793293 [Glomus cerebriforme]
MEYLRQLHKNGTIYAKSYKHNKVDLKEPVPIPGGRNIAREESKEVIFYYPNERTNHATATERSYYDSNGNHIITEVEDLHLTGVTTKGIKKGFGLGPDVKTGKELDNKDIENYTNNIHNGDNLYKLGEIINNMEISYEYAVKNGDPYTKENHDIQPYNYNEYTSKNYY